jgi:hypothetical protein
MNYQFLRHLSAAFGITSVLAIAAPVFAQPPTQPITQTTAPINQINPTAEALRSSASFSNTSLQQTEPESNRMMQEVAVSESPTSAAQPVKESLAEVEPSRIPMMSKIFPCPSMQQ